MSESHSRNTANDIPEPVAPIVELMSTFPAPWALGGGWAIDAWLGQTTREHGDVDICVFIQDQAALYEHLHGWQLVAHAPNEPVDTNELWDGHPLDLPVHIHARVDAGEAIPDQGALMPDEGFVLDLQVSDRSGDAWTLNREPRISRQLTNVIRPSPWGVPTVVPEVLLFYKAAELRRRDRLDFLALLPQLSAEQRRWLRDTLARVGHPWLQQLAS